MQPLFSKLRERKRLAAGGSDDVEFQGVKQLRQLDTDFVVMLITGRSDLGVAEIVQAMSHDPEVPYQLLAFAAQLPLSWKWPAGLYCKEAASRFLGGRAVDCGSRLRNFKTLEGLKDQTVNWTVGCDIPIFNKPVRLEKTKHCSGDKVAVPGSVIIQNENASVAENWSDTSAAILQPFMSPPPPMRAMPLRCSMMQLMTQPKSAPILVASGPATLT